MEQQLLPVTAGSVEVFVSEAAPVPLVTTHPFQYFGPDGGPLAPPLSAVGQAIVVNPRGTGASSPARSREDLSVQQLADDLEAVRRAMGIGPWIVVGQSGGGCVALLHALCHPESVAGLVLSCTTARGLGDDRSSVYHPENPDNAAVRAALAAGRSAEVRQLVAHQASRVATEPSGGLSAKRQRACAEELPQLGLAARLHEVSPPTLVVGGRHDRAIPVHHSEELAAGIPDARLVIFEASGHFPYLEEPAGYERVLVDFVSEVIGRRDP